MKKATMKKKAATRPEPPARSAPEQGEIVLYRRHTGTADEDLAIAPAMVLEAHAADCATLLVFLRNQPATVARSKNRGDSTGEWSPR